jgi:pentatricopeptide repeat protein
MGIGSATWVLLALMTQGQGHLAEPDPVDPLAPAPPPAKPGMPELRGDCPEAETFQGTEVERAGWCAAQAGELKSMRTLANQALNADERSFRAHFLMGYVQHLGEGNLPKALFHLQQAETLFIERYGERPSLTDSPWRVYHRILHQLIHLLGEMDAHEDKIHYVDEIRRRLDLDYAPFKSWPLLKLGRFDEARQIATEAIESDDAWNQAVGLTALCAVESELRNRQAAYDACQKAAERVQGSAMDGSIELSNAGAASEEMFKFDEAERLYQEAARRPAEGSVNPFGRLVRLYLRQGRFSEAMSAWREMKTYRSQRPGSYLDQQDQAEADLIGASLLLVAGRSDEAQKRTGVTVKRPDRQGTSSANAEQNEAGAAVMDRAAKLDAARQLEERAAVSTWKDALPLWIESLGLRFEAWRSGRKAAEVLANPERLVTSLRPECPGSIELPSWLDGDLIALTGPGVALAAIQEARAEETLPEALKEPIFWALEAEAHLLAGDEDLAQQLAKQALDGLGKGDGLMRARAAALLAESARQNGDVDAALAAYRLVLALDPGVLRRLGFRLPVQLEAAGTGPVTRAVELLGSSPLFELEPWGFGLRVGEAEAELLLPDGSVVNTIRVPANAGQKDDDEGAARRIAKAVQRELLVPNIDITQSDIRSLDGSLGTGKATEELKSILEEVGK